MIHGEPSSRKSHAVQRLETGVHTMRVFPDTDYTLTLAESLVLQTRPVQRMGRLRQIGLGYLIWPTAEHSRLAHCLGTAYWASLFWDRLRSNQFAQDVGDGLAPAGNRPRLDAMEDLLGPDLSLSLLIRLFALVHDMTLLPLGHTLQFQLGYYVDPDAPGHRAARCLDGIRRDLHAAFPFAPITGEPSTESVKAAVLRHVDVVECIYGVGQILKDRPWAPSAPWISRERLARWLPVLAFVHEVITSTFSADMVDFSLRDSLGLGMPRPFDHRLAEYLCVFLTKPDKPLAQYLKRQGQSPGRSPLGSRMPRLGLNPVAGTLKHEVVTGIISLQRVRYELAEKAFYHDDKLVADAMLDQAIRLIDDDSERIRRALPPFDEPGLLQLGDDEFLTLVETEERRALARRRAREKRLAPTGRGASASRSLRSARAIGHPRSVMEELRARRLFKETYRLSQPADLSPAGRRLAERAHRPEGRMEVERRLLRRVPQLSRMDLVFSCRPFTMQAKAAEVLVGWIDGQPMPLTRLARDQGYGTEVLELAKRYAGLWSLSVYLRPDRQESIPRVQEACRRLFQSGA